MNQALPKQIIGSLVLLAVLSGCGGSTGESRADGSQLREEPKLVSIDGRFRLAPSGNVTFPNYKFDGGQCYGVGGYEDVREGLQVVVRDASSVIVGTGQLRRQPAGRDTDYSACLFVWKISNIPQSGFYSIEVGNRGTIIYAHTDLQRNNFLAEATLGP